MIEEILHEGELISIIIRNKYNNEGTTFVTPGNLSQQLAYMNHPKGHTILPHVHNVLIREVHYTQEVLIVKKGKLRVDFYSRDKKYLESRILEDGDVILLVSGGHGFEVLEEIEMIEVKQGPYAGDKDKIRFNGVSSNDVVIGGKYE